MASVLLQPTFKPQGNCDGVDAVSLSVIRDFSIIANAGYLWNSQYLGGTFGTHSYNIEASWRAGLPIMLNYERQPDAAKGGYPAGRLAAETAIRQAKELGFLGEAPIVFSGADKYFPDLRGAGLEYHRAIVDVMHWEGWAGGAYGFKAMLDLVAAADWWPADWPLWHWGGDGYAIQPWATVKQWYGQKPAHYGDPRDNSGIGFAIDENTLLKPMRFWSGYGPDHLEPDTIQEDDDMPVIRQSPDGMIWSCIEAPDGHPALVDTAYEGWWVYGVLGYGDHNPIPMIDQETYNNARKLSRAEYDALCRKYETGAVNFQIGLTGTATAV